MKETRPRWDGKSRISTNNYRERWQEIFGSKTIVPETHGKESKMGRKPLRQTKAS